MRTTTSIGSRGIVGKLIFSAFGLFFAFMGSMFAKQEWQSLQEIRAMQKWTAVPCTIETSRLEDHGEDFRLAVTYSYRVDGHTFTCDQYGMRKYFTADSIAEIKSAEKKLQPGKVIDGHCNPDHPSEAVLNLPAIGSARSALTFSLIFPAAGILISSIPWLRSRKSRRSRPSATQAKSPKIFLLIFGSVFALFGSIMIKPFLITPLQKSQDSKTWNEIAAVVVSSKVKSHSDDDGTTYSPYIAYRYTIDGEEYFGDRYTFVGGSSSGRDRKAAIVRQYPNGREFTLYVNPADPSESVIIRDAGAELLFGLIPLVFTIIGIAIIIGGFKAGKASPKKLDDRQAREHIIELKGKSRLGAALFITLFAIVWNGAVYLIYRADAGPLFLSIFGFFGIVSIVLAVKTILSMFNPRPSVEITPGDIRPGTSVAVRWRMDGKVERIRRLAISVQCLRVTTETSGSGKNRSTRVVKTPVYDEEVQTTTHPREIATGTAQFHIPEEKPFSLPGNHGGIQWQLTFRGDIPRWPDIKEEMEFLVYPARS